MNYFSPDGTYELRKAGKNVLPNANMKYAVNNDKQTISVDGKEYFNILSEDRLLIPLAGKFLQRCDMSKSKEVQQILDENSNKIKEEAARNSTKYVLSSENIKGWGQIPNGVVFKLKPDNYKELKELMIKEKGKKIAFYAKDILIDVVLIQEPLNKDELFLPASDDLSAQITSALKAEIGK